MSQPVLGEIELEKVIGRGGMAVVWRGTSRRENLPVAVKLLTQTDDPVQVRRFHDEIRSVARLRHTNIVDVVEMGVVPEELVDRGPGLQPGTPWLAMQYVHGGTLRDYAPRLSWKDVRALLMQILGALAHAHARGVIHRDLKPTNVLVERDPEHGLQARISDFGIAYTRGLPDRDSAFESKVSGTPKYMSPEQIEGRWRDHGPWTDLYAVGCIAYWLVSGRPPFSGDVLADLLRGHLYGTVEALEGERPLPRGFDRWCGNLLRKDIRKRYRCAADAAYGLARLGGIGSDGHLWHHAESVENDDDVTEAFTQKEWASVEHQRFDRSTLQITPGEVERPPLPRSWRAIDHGHSVRHPGLSLFALRTPPMVGRDELLDGLWSALEEVIEHEQPRCVLLRGRQGTGKSRIADFLGQRAYEVGAATRMFASHSNGGGPSSGLGAMFARHLECFGLDLETVEGRVADWWASGGRMDATAMHDVRVLARFMPNEGSGSRDSGVFVSNESPLETFERALRVVAAERPVCLWLDDLQWDTESIAFVEHLLRTRDLPVLIVGTAQVEAIDDDPDVDAALKQLATQAGCEVFNVGGLDDETQAALIGNMLPLDEASVDELVRRTGGNPLFAVQLLDECVDRGAIVASEGRFGLSPEANIRLSDDVREVWVQRIENALEGLTPERRRTAWMSLELAAAMGHEVEDAQWRHACNLADLQVDQTTFERYLDSHLVERVEGQWSFAHSSLRDVLEQHARDEGRWRKHCHVCAESVRWFGNKALGELERRRALYFLQAEDQLTALTPLLEAARKKLAAGRGAEAERLRARHQSLCDALGLPATDPHRVRNQLVRAEFARADKNIEAGVAYARLAVNAARECADVAVLIDALLVRGRIMRHRDADEALRAHDEAIALCETISEPNLHLMTMVTTAETHAYHPTSDAAVEVARAAVAEAAWDNDPLEARARLVLATALRQEGEFAAAAQEASTARRITEERGDTSLTHEIDLETSRICRLDGRWSEAERWAQRARNSLRGHGELTRARAELEHALAARHRYAPERTVRECLKALGRGKLLETDVRSAEAYFVLVALEPDSPACDKRVQRGRPAVEVGAFDRCLAVAIDAAADACAESGNLERANELWSLARMQWRRLGLHTVSPR